MSTIKKFLNLIFIDGLSVDVLAERGLIRMESGQHALVIHLTPEPGKVDLENSAILLRLRNQKRGV